MKRPILPSATYPLRDAIGQGQVVGFNAGPSGEVYVMLAIEPLDYRTAENGFATFAKTVPSSPQRYRILAVREGDIELDLTIEHERLNLHDIQPLGDDLLLACLRSDYRGPADFDLNARVYARDGTFLREFFLGDGIETIQATRRGEVWASYFDEGVFGNHGWNDPAGASGLVAWSSMGKKIYEYEATADLNPISDCYALNAASNDDTWLCYYTDFPLVHLHRQRVAASWNVPVTGSHAFAVGAGHALFAGAYGDPDSFRLVRLGPNRAAMQVGQFELRAEDGAPLKLERVVGRGDSLHVFSDGALYKIVLGDVLGRLSASR